VDPDAGDQRQPRHVVADRVEPRAGLGHLEPQPRDLAVVGVDDAAGDQDRQADDVVHPRRAGRDGAADQRQDDRDDADGVGGERRPQEQLGQRPGERPVEVAAQPRVERLVDQLVLPLVGGADRGAIGDREAGAARHRHGRRGLRVRGRDAGGEVGDQRGDHRAGVGGVDHQRAHRRVAAGGIDRVAGAGPLGLEGRHQLGGHHLVAGVDHQQRAGQPRLRGAQLVDGGHHHQPVAGEAGAGRHPPAALAQRQPSHDAPVASRRGQHHRGAFRSAHGRAVCQGSWRSTRAG
jgi:hypothetical protein